MILLDAGQPGSACINVLALTIDSPPPHNEQVLNKSATTLGAIARSSGAGGRACAAVRLVHRVEVEVGFQLAQLTGRGEVRQLSGV